MKDPFYSPIFPRGSKADLPPSLIRRSWLAFVTGFLALLLIAAIWFTWRFG